MSEQAISRIPGFYKLNLERRREVILERTKLSDDALDALNLSSGLSLETANHMIENAVGVFALPLGLALNFCVDGHSVLVPMAVEEPSVIAACSHIAFLVAKKGGFKTNADPSLMCGQIQIPAVKNPEELMCLIEERSAEIEKIVNSLCPGLKARGGGFHSVQTRILGPVMDGEHAEWDSKENMLVIDFTIDCCDAMGANAINTVAEGLAPYIEEWSGEKVLLRILSNLADKRTATAHLQIAYQDLPQKDVPEVQRLKKGREIAAAMVDAYRFAARDPYRAATHNKGIMNGIDALVIATGNDWRAIEAGAHAFAARDGQYRSLSFYRLNEKEQCLEAMIRLPIAVGTVGGATQVHPTVKLCRELCRPFSDSATKLATLIAAVGLAQNCAALKALATTGIQQGHMALHARQVALAAGAVGEEIESVTTFLRSEKCFKVHRASAILEDLRAKTLKGSKEQG